MAEGSDHSDVRGDVRAQIREFLATRRARITPEQAALPVYGGDRRRVPGLRRSEVASLAGISPEYMTKLERGNGRDRPWPPRSKSEAHDLQSRKPD